MDPFLTLLLGLLDRRAIPGLSSSAICSARPKPAHISRHHREPAHREPTSTGRAVVSLADCDRISRDRPRPIHRFTLLQNLQLIRSGWKSRGTGIRRCPDSDQPWIDDHTGLTYCTAHLCRIDTGSGASPCLAARSPSPSLAVRCAFPHRQIPLF